MINSSKNNFMRHLWKELNSTILLVTFFMIGVWIFPIEKSAKIFLSVGNIFLLTVMISAECKYYKNVVEPKEKEIKNDLSEMQ